MLTFLLALIASCRYLLNALSLGNVYLPPMFNRGSKTFVVTQ